MSRCHGDKGDQFKSNMENMTLEILKRKVLRKQITRKDHLGIKVCDFILFCTLVYAFVSLIMQGRDFFVHTRKYCIYLFIFYFFSIILWSEGYCWLDFSNDEWVEGEILVEQSIVLTLRKYYYKRTLASMPLNNTIPLEA